MKEDALSQIAAAFGLTICGIIGRNAPGTGSCINDCHGHNHQ
jgi:hypothetical protein